MLKFGSIYPFTGGRSTTSKLFSLVFFFYFSLLIVLESFKIKLLKCTSNYWLLGGLIGMKMIKCPMHMFTKMTTDDERCCNNVLAISDN